MIAQSTMHEGVGKAVYLAPDNYLAKQVREEAAQLDVATTDGPYDPAFLTAQAVLVTNYQKLINGKSAFGAVGAGKEPVDLGIVVVDDAHAALARTESQFRLRLPVGHEAYGTLLELFAEDLQYRSANAWKELEDEDPHGAGSDPVLGVGRQARRGAGDPAPHRDEREFMFVWPLIAEVLQLSTATATSKAIEIRPSCTPIDRIPSLVRARRRVYLTATLADDSALVTDFGADPALVAKLVTPGSAADLGERMILAPVALNPDLDNKAVRVLARQFANGRTRAGTALQRRIRSTWWCWCPATGSPRLGRALRRPHLVGRRPRGGREGAPGRPCRPGGPGQQVRRRQPPGRRMPSVDPCLGFGMGNGFDANEVIEAGRGRRRDRGSVHDEPGPFGELPGYSWPGGCPGPCRCREGQPFILGGDGSYDLQLNRFLRELPSWGVRAENSVLGYARDVMLFVRFLETCGMASRSGRATAMICGLQTGAVVVWRAGCCGGGDVKPVGGGAGQVGGVVRS
ncbi:hypothetical protein ACTWQF_30720 [Streptomyces sp. 8N114]|uniref:hypothetical protein n=1 Tax=Streptomyces sp. 8N114 TaxID=3457419 RepID=UPI003FD0267A